MKKSMALLFGIVILMTNLCGCTAKTQHDVYKEIYKRYYSMESFYAAAEVTVYTDKTEDKYYVRQFFKAPDRYSFVVDSPEALAGSGYVAKDGKFLLKSGFGQNQTAAISFPGSKDVMFLCDFFEQYYKSEETFVETAGNVLEKETALCCFVPGKNEKRFMQSLKIDNKTFLPTVLETYDIDKNPVVTVVFKDFKRNCDIDEKIFE